MKKKSVSQCIRRGFNEGGFFKLRLLLGLLLCFGGITVVLFALGQTAAGQPRTPSGHGSPLMGGFAAANKIAPWVMEHTANGQQAEFFVVLTDQADLGPGRELADESRKGALCV